jgi:hypothetical protein
VASRIRPNVALIDARISIVDMFLPFIVTVSVIGFLILNTFRASPDPSSVTLLGKVIEEYLTTLFLIETFNGRLRSLLVKGFGEC